MSEYFVFTETKNFIGTVILEKEMFFSDTGPDLGPKYYFTIIPQSLTTLVQ